MYATYGIPTIKKSCPISDVSYRFYRCYHTKLAFQHHNLKTDIQVEIISVRPCTLRGLNERPSLRLVMVPMVKDNGIAWKLSDCYISYLYQEFANRTRSKTGRGRTKPPSRADTKSETSDRTKTSEDFETSDGTRNPGPGWTKTFDLRNGPD